MGEHLRKLENLGFRLRTLQVDLCDDLLISKIFSILTDGFEHFAMVWESTNPQHKTLTNLMTRLLTEGKRQNAGKENPIAFATGKRCYKCNKPGYLLCTVGLIYT